MLRPLVKWAGGKRQIMDKIMSHFPEEFGDYYEPFVGAGSVFMEMQNRELLHGKRVYLSDVMQTLMNMYTVVRDAPFDLIDEIDTSGKYQNDRESFLGKRRRFNELKGSNPSNSSDTSDSSNPSVELAALFIYLNKTGFNGMYRENKMGEFNIPFGSQKNPSICCHENIDSLHRFLSEDSVTMRCADYETWESCIREGDFVYMDPPYYNTFTTYNKDDFGRDSQIRLRDFVLRLTNRGVKIALSNSCDPFILEIYSGIPNVRFIEIEVKRLINSKAAARGDVKKELLIVNYVPFV
jgi:DNA adenine methylase